MQKKPPTMRHASSLGRPFILAGAAVLLFCSVCSAGQDLTYADLVNRLTDMEHLAVLPESGEQCAQASSYDRASHYVPETGEYVNWAHNGDGTGIVRMEGDEAVLADIQGPGVIWRFWMALAGEGHIKIYLDGAEKPVLDLPATAYFSGKQPPFNRPGLVYEASSGKNSYVPIPFQKTCKITASGDWGRYYEFTYGTFPEGTTPPSFQEALDPEGSAALDRASERLSRAGRVLPDQYPDQQQVSVSEVVEPGEAVSFHEVNGPRAIVALDVKPEYSGTIDDRDRLRELILRITWDNEEYPAVLAPLGDFFGTAPGINFYKSWPMGMTPEGFYSHWYMPFAEHARIEIVNEGPDPQEVSITIQHAALSRPTSELGRFNVIWHDGLKSDPGRPIDWFFLDTRGWGRFCGLALHIWNPLGGWWGEGDEKFYVDGEKFPSTHGTGSEDYFGYAWCDHNPFERPFHNQTHSVPMNPCANPTREESGGWTSNNRWHIADNIPFQESFLASIEKYLPDDRPTRYEATVYWYADKLDVNRPALPPLERRMYEQEAREEQLFDLLDDLKNAGEDTPIKPLRQAFKDLSGDPVVGRLQEEVVVRMAAAEAITGHVERATRMLSPLREKLTIPFIARDFGAAIRTALGEKSQSEEAIKPDLVPNGDGSVLRVQEDGRWCIATQKGHGWLYVYFDFPEEANVRDTDQTYLLEIEFRTVSGRDANVLVEYDSLFSDDIDGMYHLVTASAEKTGEAGWNKVEVELPRAKFSGRQNGGADLRVCASGPEDLYVASVVLKRP